MKIESGNECRDNVKPVEGDTVRFVMEDGRTAFEVSIGRDGRSIEVRSVMIYKFGDKLCDNTLLVAPNAANSITISTPFYENP